jgi:hypothetical protein
MRPAVTSVTFIVFMMSTPQDARADTEGAAEPERLGDLHIRPPFDLAQHASGGAAAQ